MLKLIEKNNAVIKVECRFLKVLREEKNGSVKVYVKNEFSNHILNESPLIIRFSKKQWNNIKELDIYNQVFKITGHFQASVDQRGVPFTLIFCEALARRIKKDEKNFEYQEYDFKKSIPWYKMVDSKEFISLNINDIFLSEDIHLKSKISCVNLESMKKFKDITLAVRKCGNKYELVSGLKAFLAAKIFNMPVKAYITDLKYFEFREKYEIE